MQKVFLQILFIDIYETFRFFFEAYCFILY